MLFWFRHRSSPPDERVGKMSLADGWPRCEDESFPFNLATFLLRSFLLLCMFCCSASLLSSISVYLGRTDRKTAPAGLKLVPSVHGARGHLVFSDDLIGLAGLHT